MPRGHRLYTSPATLRKRDEASAFSDASYDHRGYFVSRPGKGETWADYSPTRIGRVAAPPTLAADGDAPYWIGIHAANDNCRGRAVPQPNDCPDQDYAQRRANPGTTREYEGDLASRLLKAGNLESYFVFRAVRALLSPAGLLAANDNGAEDADNEMGDGFGLEYAFSEDNGDKALERFAATGRLPTGILRFRQRSGNPGSRITGKHRKEERDGLHIDRYLALRGVALPSCGYVIDSEMPWRSHRPINAAASAELAKACDRTDWKKVTWVRYAPMGARVYGALGVCSEMKGTGEAKASAAAHPAVREIFRQGAEKEFRGKMSERSMRIIDAIIRRDGYETVGKVEGLSRNGAKKAVESALREAWTALQGITGEKLSAPPEKLAA